MSKLRANFYVDGFNLYMGVCNTGDKSLLWTNFAGLARDIRHRKTEKLNQIHYFIPKPRSPSWRRRVHQNFLELLRCCSWTIGESHEHIVAHEGFFWIGQAECHLCHGTFDRGKNKGDRAGLAVQIVDDLYNNQFDVAYLISADNEFLPVVRFIREKFPEKTIKVWFPPTLVARHLAAEADVQGTVLGSMLRKHRLPEYCWLPDGRVLQAPYSWFLPNSNN